MNECIEFETCTLFLKNLDNEPSKKKLRKKMYKQSQLHLSFHG